MRRLAALVLASSVLVLGGCFGGGDDGSSRSSTRPRDELSERLETLRGVPRADRAAFYQLATAAGLLRERASLAAVGKREPAGFDTELDAARGRAGAVRPRVAGLVSLRERLLGDLRAGAAVPRTPTAGRALLQRVDGFTTALRRFVRSDPRFSALVPD